MYRKKNPMNKTKLTVVIFLNVSRQNKRFTAFRAKKLRKTKKYEHSLINVGMGEIVLRNLLV